MPVMPIVMFIVYMMGLLSISFLGFRYFPGPMICVCNVLGILTVFWAIGRFFYKKSMFDCFQYILHTLYTVCIFMIWKNFAVLAHKHLSGEDITPFIPSAVYAESSLDWMIYSVQWLCMVITATFVLYWIIKWLRAFVIWWRAPGQPNVNSPLWRGDHYAYTRDKEPSRLLEMHGGKLR